MIGLALGIACHRSPASVEPPVPFRIEGRLEMKSNPLNSGLQFIRKTTPGNFSRFIPTPGYVLEVIPKNRIPIKTPCSVTCSGGMIVGQNNDQVSVIGENFDCRWVAEVPLREPMYAYRIWQNGRLVIEEIVQHETILFEKSK